MAYTTIDDPSAHFQTLAYRGNSTSTTTSDRSLTNEGNSNLQPDLVWIANRDTAINSGMRWWDSSRGVGQNLGLTSSGTNAEGSPNDPEYGYVNSLNTNGFGVRAGSNDSNGRWTVDRGEGGGDKYVAWQWKANGGTTSSNTTGTITSTVQANTDAGFNIVTYTGNGVNSNFGHGMGEQPDMVIVKRRNAAANWCVWHKDLTSSYYMQLDTTISQQTGPWDGLDPSSGLVYVYSGALVNGNGDNYVAYIFKGKQGFSKFGKYVGNGNTDGTFVYTGFKPAFVMTKNIGVADSWVMMDSARSPSNVANKLLVANEVNAENTSFDCFDFLSNGFKNRRATSQNVSGNNYIYMAFAENPFTTSTGIPTTAR